MVGSTWVLRAPRAVIWCTSLFGVQLAPTVAPKRPIRGRPWEIRCATGLVGQRELLAELLAGPVVRRLLRSFGAMFEGGDWMVGLGRAARRSPDQS